MRIVLDGLLVHLYHDRKKQKEIDHQVLENRSVLKYNLVLTLFSCIILIDLTRSINIIHENNEEVLLESPVPVYCLKNQYLDGKIYPLTNKTTTNNLLLVNNTPKKFNPINTVEDILNIRGGNLFESVGIIIIVVVWAFIQDKLFTDGLETPAFQKRGNFEYMGSGISIKRDNNGSSQRQPNTVKFAEKMIDSDSYEMPKRRTGEEIKRILNDDYGNRTLIEDNLYISQSRAFAKYTHARQWNVTPKEDPITPDDMVFLQSDGIFKYLLSGRPLASIEKIRQYINNMRSFIFDSQTLKVQNVRHIDNSGFKECTLYIQPSGQFICFDALKGDLLVCGKLRGAALKNFEVNKSIGSIHLNKERLLIPQNVKVPENNLTGICNITNELSFDNTNNFTLNESKIITIQNLNDFR